MTRQQVGWYDGSRVHQMHARPVGEVPRHLAHTAGWVAVYPDAEVTEIPAVCATCSGRGVIGGFQNSAAPGYVTEDCPDCSPRAPLPPSLQAEARAIGACGDADSLEPAEPVL